MRKQIFMLWKQGFDRAPAVVNACADAWKRLNPEYDFVPLTEAEYEAYVQEIGINLDNVPIQGRSVMMRMHLLHTRGGVWADATLFPTQPVREWLEPRLDKDGFCVFGGLAPDRPMANWFIAANKGDPTLGDWLQAGKDYWTFIKNRKFGWDKVTPVRVSRQIFRGQSYQLVGYLGRRIWPVVPYYWSHYLFDHLLHTDRDFKARFEAMKPHLSASKAHYLQFGGKRLPVPEVGAYFEQNHDISPVHKLTWQDQWPIETIERLTDQFVAKYAAQANAAVQSQSSQDQPQT